MIKLSFRILTQLNFNVLPQKFLLIWLFTTNRAETIGNSTPMMRQPGGSPSPSRTFWPPTKSRSTASSMTGIENISRSTGGERGRSSPTWRGVWSGCTGFMRGGMRIISTTGTVTGSARPSRRFIRGHMVTHIIRTQIGSRRGRRRMERAGRRLFTTTMETWSRRVIHTPSPVMR